MLITFFMPTRHRPSLAQKSIEALVKTCSRDPFATFEVLGYVDDDDPQQEAYIEAFKPFGTHIVGKRYKYPDLHMCVMEKLLPFAQGEWLCFWNDDAVINTYGWDETLRKEQPDYVLCPDTPQSAHGGAPNTFPITPRKWVDLVGWAKNGANDTWWEVVGKMITRHKNIDWFIEHKPTDSSKQGYDSSTFFNMDTYAKMGFAAGRIQQKFYAR